MADKQDKHPYAPSPGGVAAAITQLRKSFPKSVTAATLKKLGIAPSNESYVINVLRFIGAIDADGNRTDRAAAAFAQSDADFPKGFEDMLRDAYADLIQLHRDEAWELSLDKLKSYFRNTDRSTDLVGRLQAQTFQLLAAFAGHGEIPAPVQTKTPSTKTPSTKPKPATPKSKAATPVGSVTHIPTGNPPSVRDFALAVRIEVNLPPGGDQETYDRIFRSIRENLLNGK